jgi:hypothetical protein
MRRGGLWSLALVVTLLAAGSGCGIPASVSALTCIGDPTEPMLQRVRQEPILNQAPVGVVPQSSQSEQLACSDNDLIGEVELPYEFVGSPRDVVAFYKEKAAAEGWRLTRDGLIKLVPRPGKSESWPTTTCFAKDLGGFVADLQVSFDYWSPDVTENPSVQRYWRIISFSTTGGNCANNVDLDF